MQRSRVLLPDPDGPMTQTTRESSTERSTPRRTWTAPNRLCRPSTSTTGLRSMAPRAASPLMTRG